MNIRVKLTKQGGTVKTMALEEYLRGVVPAEVYPSWPIEALKAQAIAARTYAAHMAQTKAEKPFDIDDTTANQSYDPAKIDPRTDKAIQETAGQILTYGGKILDTCVYCASNGGETVFASARWGSDRPYLPAKPDPYDRAVGKPRNGHGVGMSQWGAQEMARQGQDHKAILAFYYPGAVIGALDAPKQTVAAPATSTPSTATPTIAAPFSGVQTFSLRRDGSKMLSAHFKVKEFAIDKRCTGDEVKICGELVGLLQCIRNHFGKPVNISSGYRTPAGTSQHNHGRAVDFRIDGVDPREIVRWIEANINPPGLGLYDYNPKTAGKTGFVHIDMRLGAKARWVQTTPDDSTYRSLGGRDISVAYL